MYLCILTVGSRGDIQPHIALGLGLKAAGHQVCMVTHSSYEAMVRRRGLDFQPVAGRPQEIVSQAGQLLLETGRNFLRFMLAFKDVMEPLALQLLSDLQAGCREADAILYSAFTFPGHYLAREMGVPAVMTALQPLARSRDHTTLLAPLPSNLGGTLNLATHLVAEQLFWHPLRPVRQCSAELPISSGRHTAIKTVGEEIARDRRHNPFPSEAATQVG